MKAAMKVAQRTLVHWFCSQDFDIKDLNVHIAHTRNGYECKVIPIMYNMSPAKVSEIKAEKREIFNNLTESVISIDDGSDWCSDFVNIDSGKP